MKTKIIRLLQRWAKTIQSPALDPLCYKVENLGEGISRIRNELDLQRKQIDDLAWSVLHDRWHRQPACIASRAELGYWLNFHRLLGEGIEVGVHKGHFSELLLRTWQGRRLYSVDPWREFDREEYADICNVTGPIQEQNFEETSKRLARFGNRSVILRKTSREAAASFENGSLDFVYIDAQHHYEAVREDIALWDQKVRPGGILGGHDYLDGEQSSGRYGVKRAVTEWGEQQNYPVLITREGPFPSWFVIKPAEDA